VNDTQPADVSDPIDLLVDRYFTAPPCSTRQSHQVARADHLEDLFDAAGAVGVVIHTVKFCEPELFDQPVLRARFESRGIPTLVIESELESELSAQTETRLEAFVEMLGSRAIGRSA
jgi:benzoyl-CoA reductase/2-hydroxyglutaryl-CoA dehydratase subunit BcrC/BadD/HgdB